MQVELAQLSYQSTRLVGEGVALSRLAGGIGTRGPGESKLEMNRRRIRRAHRPICAMNWRRWRTPAGAFAARAAKKRSAGGGAGGLHQRGQVHAA